MSLELKPEKVKPYLKLLTEACVSLNTNKGSFRKDIWDYLYKKYANAIDYKDFLLAIRRFAMDGKVINVDGVYSMHHAVIEEVREKTPTPVFKKTAEGKTQDSSLYLKSLKGLNKKAGTSRKTKTVASKISDSGKKQKVKPVKESPRQGKISRYFMKKQIKNLDFKEYQRSENSVNKKLGFATPAFDSLRLKKIAENYSPPKSEITMGSKGFGIMQKHRDQFSHQQVRRKILEHNLSQVTKAIHKFKKPSAKEQIIQATKAMKAVASTEASTVEVKKISTKELQEGSQKPEKSKKKEELQSRKNKLEQKGKSKLATRVIKALKKAIENKNLRFRNKNDDEDDKKNVEKVRPAKLKKTKSIKKPSKANKVQRTLNKLRNGWPLILKQRLRGKTLDLTKLGLVKPESQKGKKEKQPQKLTKKSEKTKPLRVEVAEVNPKKVESAPTTPKKEKKTKINEKRVSRSVQKPEGKNKRLLAGLNQSKKPISERKAKIDAVKHLHQLFKKDKSDALFMNEKLIYI